MLLTCECLNLGVGIRVLHEKILGLDVPVDKIVLVQVAPCQAKQQLMNQLDVNLQLHFTTVATACFKPHGTQYLLHVGCRTALIKSASPILNM